MFCDVFLCKYTFSSQKEGQQGPEFCPIQRAAARNKAHCQSSHNAAKKREKSLYFGTSMEESPLKNHGSMREKNSQKLY